MRTTIILVCLSITLGCGKEQSNPNPPTKPEPASEVKEPSARPKVDPTKHERFLWESELGSSIGSSTAIGPDGTVFAGFSGNKLYALSGKTGVKLWEFQTGGYGGSSPAIGSDGTVYVGSGDKKLYAINGKTRVRLWEFETGGRVLSSPAIGSDGTVYVGSWDKKLYALSGKTGVKLWEFETGGPIRYSPAIGPDGTVYVGSSDSKLYAIKTDSKGPAKSPWPMFRGNPQHTGRAPAK